jgi:hypothetical protein
MEADWEIEIGPGAPIIDANWPGFVDLRRSPQAAANIPETVALPGLASALAQLNNSQPPYGTWTSKCDVWQIADPTEIDPYEFDASLHETTKAWACYFDLLPVSDQQWGHVRPPGTGVPTAAVEWCKSACITLRAIPLRRCRADLIIRKAALRPDTTGIGITVYLTACGSTSESAKQLLSETLQRFVDSFQPQSTVE